jgi:dCTP deaminase
VPVAYLTAPLIRHLIEQGEVEVEPYIPAHVGPNSVDLRLHPELKVYVNDVLDMREDNPTRTILIPEDGFVLQPGELYLGRTIERTYTPFHLPCVEGRSSVGRLGISVHATAGFGDHGFNGTWTLEIEVTKPVRVYPGVRICQMSLAELVGDLEPYVGRYQGQEDATASRFHL